MPGLLDRGAPHVIQVEHRVPYVDIGGSEVFVPITRVSTRCAVQVARDWSAAEETTGLDGLQVLDMRVIYSRTWAGDVNSWIYWDGDIYEMVGAPQPLKMSRRTAHWRSTVRRIGTDPDA